MASKESAYNFITDALIEAKGLIEFKNYAEAEKLLETASRRFKKKSGIDPNSDDKTLWVDIDADEEYVLAKSYFGDDGAEVNDAPEGVTELYHTLGRVYLLDNKPSEAIDAFLISLKFNPVNCDALLAVADICFAIDKQTFLGLLTRAYHCAYLPYQLAKIYKAYAMYLIDSGKPDYAFSSLNLAAFFGGNDNEALYDYLSFVYPGSHAVTTDELVEFLDDSDIGYGASGVVIRMLESGIDHYEEEGDTDCELILLKELYDLTADPETAERIAALEKENDIFVPDENETAARIDKKQAQLLKKELKAYNKRQTDANLINLYRSFRKSCVIVPCTQQMSDRDRAKFEELIKHPETAIGTDITCEDEVRMIPDKLQNNEGYWYPVYTSGDEIGEEEADFDRMETPFFNTVCQTMRSDELQGMVINAFSDDAVVLTKEMLTILERDYKQNG